MTIRSTFTKRDPLTDLTTDTQSKTMAPRTPDSIAGEALDDDDPRRGREQPDPPPIKRGPGCQPRLPDEK